MKWVEEINKMFAENEYTDKGIVTVDFCENANIIVISVLGEKELIDINKEGLSSYGL